MNNSFFNKLLILIFLGVSIVSSFYFGFKLLIILIPFILAWLISGLLSPIVYFIHNKTKINKTLLTFLSLIMFIIICSLLVSVIGFLIINQAENLLSRFPEIAELTTKIVVKRVNDLLKLTDTIPSYLSNNLEFDTKTILQNINLSVTTILASLIGVVAFIPNILVSIIVMFVASFFMTKDRTKLVKLERKFFSNNFFKHKIILVIKHDILLVFVGYLKAQVILMSITFVELSIGLSILSVPHSILIALGISILDVLPILGTGTIFIPWVIILLFYKDFSMAIGIFAVYLVATLTRQSIEPKIISTQIGIHPLITLITIYTGIRILGFSGIIIAPLFVICLVAIKKSGILKFK